jgi:hypothetical protein
MAGIALKVYLFSLILSFCFLYYAGSLGIGSTGSNQATYNQALNGTTATLQNKANELFASNAASLGITIIGIVLDNTLVALAGISWTLLSAMTIQNALFNESFGNDIGTFITGILVFLYVIGLISWWSGRSEP